MRLHLPPPMYRPWILLLLACPLTVLGQMASLSPESEALASQTLSRPAQEQKQDLKKVLEEVGTQYQVNFIFDNRLVDQKMATLPRKSDPLEVALQQLLTPLDLSFKKLDEQHYVIKKSEHKSATVEKVQSSRYHEPSVTASLDLTPIPNQLFHENRQDLAVEQTIAGTVSDEETGEPLPGVNILAKGTTTGTITDLDGKYRLTVNDGVTTLVFSSIGYVTQEISINGQSTINLTMQQDIQSLSEVVVVGYGTQQKRDLTGSISSVKSEEIKDIPVSQADALLQGRAAGVQVVQNSGTPGAEIFVRVRGSGSLLGESRPLYVIDGVPMNNISNTFLNSGGQRPSALGDINPNDIESMEVLKDASATAIYGARGSNGVVLITTKKGKTGDARFNFDAYTGIQSVWKTLDLLNGEQFVDLIDDARINRGQEPFDELTVTGQNTDYQDEIFRNAPISNYNLSVSGGSEKLSSFVSAGYFTQDGTIIGQSFKRINGRVNLDYQASKKIKLGTNTVISHTDIDKVSNDFSGYSILGNALLRNPNLPVYNEDNTYSVDPLLSSENPVMLANEITHDAIQKRIISNLYAEWQIIENLQFRTTFGFDNLSLREQYFVPSFILGQAGVAEAEAVSYEELTWQNENTLNYQKNFGEHSLSFLVGLSFLESQRTSLQAGGSAAGSNLITTIAISNPFIPENYLSTWGLQSYFGRVNYEFADKYLLNASLRADGSSRFGENNRYGVFPSISVGWRISAEPFMQGLSWIDDLKLRASYGVTGNQDGLPDFPSLALYGTGQNYDGLPGIAQTQIVNPDLSWESTLQTNVGIDLSLVKGKINLNVDAYYKETKDLIFTRNLPWTSGFSSIPRANLGDLENRGLELGLFTRNFTGAFTWTTNFNISFNRNVITFLPSNGESGSDYIFDLPDAYGSEGPYSIYRVGEAVGSFYGYNFQGVYARDEDVPEAFFEAGVRGGDVIYEDVNDDGFYSRQDDRVIIGNALPLHTGGFTNTFGYKNFSLTVFMNWSYGNDIYNMTNAVLVAMSEENNQSIETLNRWTTPGQVTDMPRALYGSSSVSGAAPTDVSSRYLEDGSFLRVKNVNLSYNIPNTLLERVSINSARVYVAAQNLLTFTNYSGMDPENQNQGNNEDGTSVPTLGVDYLTQPQARTYTIGINLSF